MDDKPSVFLESHNISNMYGGFGQFNYWLIKNLISVDDQFSFTVFAKNKQLIREFLPEAEFKRYHTFHRRELFRIRKKYNLWHSLNQNSKIEPYHDLPYIMTIHDVIFLEEGLMSEIEKQKRIQLLQEKIQRSKAIVYISEYARNSTNKYFTIPESIKEHVIYNGTPPLIKHNLSGVEKPKGLQKPFLFSIGQFMEKKNFHTLIGMLVQLKDFQLVIAGNHNMAYRKIIESEIAKHKLEGEIFFPGKISEQEKQYYFENCRAFVFPSLHEGFGIPPLEAMTYGKPVFLANRTSLPEIGGKEAFYWEHFDPEYMSRVLRDGLQKYDNDPAYPERLKTHAATFNWSQTAEEYLKVYKSVINSK